MRTRHDSRGNELTRRTAQHKKIPPDRSKQAKTKPKQSQNKPRQTVQTGFSYGIYTGLVVCGTLTLVRGNLDRTNLSFFKLLMRIGTTLQSGMPQSGMPQPGMLQPEALQSEALKP